jgi:hypothetical protein
MADWVPKSRALEHPVYGIIDSSRLIKVVTKFIGVKGDPLTNFVSLRNSESIFEFEDVIKIDKNKYSKVYLDYDLDCYFPNENPY